MTRALVLTLVLLLGACATAATETADEIRITFGAGGFVNQKLRQYVKYDESNKRVVIDGQVISADAFFAFAVRKACYTKNAVFSPHAASYLGLIPDRETTRKLAALLPPPLRTWFENDIAYYDWVGFSSLDYDGLRKIWPEGECGTRAS